MSLSQSDIEILENSGRASDLGRLRKQGFGDREEWQQNCNGIEALNNKEQRLKEATLLFPQTS